MNAFNLKFPEDYYGMGYSLFKKNKVTIREGLTVLIGCNGAGKSTFLRICGELLDKEPDTLVLKYSNQFDGGKTAQDMALLQGNTDKLARLSFGSEGEAMAENLATLAGKIGTKVRNSEAKNIVLLLDAMDSGYSIDNIIEMKGFFDFLQAEEPNRTFYIIAAANSFELARNENCLDIQEMKYRKFTTYEGYRNFILKTRVKRDELAGIKSDKKEDV